MISEQDYCERCELFNGDIVNGWCAYCRSAFDGERGELFTWAFGSPTVPVFRGFSTGETWNGFAVPSFDFDEAVAVCRELEDCGFISQFRVKNSALTLSYVQEGETVEVHARQDGRYVFDGFTWDAVDVTGDDTQAVLFGADARIALGGRAEVVLDWWRDELLELWADYGNPLNAQATPWPSLGAWLND